MATLTCNVNDGLAQQWLYNSMNIGGQIAPAFNQVPAVPAVPLLVGGVVFRLSLLSITPDLASQITFAASENMDGRMVECRTAAGSDVITDRTTLQVGRESEYRYKECMVFSNSIFSCLDIQN
jgi:hypothetical protein